MKELWFTDTKVSIHGNFVEIASDNNRDCLDVEDAKKLVEFLTKYIEENE